MRLDVARRPGALLALGLVVLVLGATLCLLDDDVTGMDPCGALIALTTGLVVAFELEPVGRLAPALAPSYHLTPADLRSPPPKR